MENNLLEDRLNYHCTNQCKDYHEDGSCMKPMMCGFRTYMLATINDFHFYKKELELYKKAVEICAKCYKAYGIHREDIKNGKLNIIENDIEWQNYFLDKARKELENGK